MTKDPTCCLADTALEDVSQMMCENDCGAIPVVESEANLRPIGIITDRDIACRAFTYGKNPLELTAGECMSQPCVTVTPDTDLEECLAILKQHQVRRIPVVDDNGECCGIVSQADIAIHAPEYETAEFVKEVSEDHAGHHRTRQYRY
ncbi:MAG: CBS domain-containing protein [Candidatus Omnitrophica bacterium]|nr:CBS domain-containing protein [Candidatus Omnitrophota bacterium]